MTKEDKVKNLRQTLGQEQNPREENKENKEHKQEMSLNYALGPKVTRLAYSSAQMVKTSMIAKIVSYIATPCKGKIKVTFKPGTLNYVATYTFANGLVPKIWGVQKEKNEGVK